MNVLQAAMQPEVVEVRMQFADWLLRSGFPISDALEQLGAASDLLLEIEEGSEDEEEDEAGADARYYSGLADRGDNDSDDGGSSVAPLIGIEVNPTLVAKKEVVQEVVWEVPVLGAWQEVGRVVNRAAKLEAKLEVKAVECPRERNHQAKRSWAVKLWICLNWDWVEILQNENQLENLEFPNSKHNPNWNNEKNHHM